MNSNLPISFNVVNLFVVVLLYDLRRLPSVPASIRVVHCLTIPLIVEGLAAAIFLKQITFVISRILNVCVGVISLLLVIIELLRAHSDIIPKVMIF